MLAPPRLRLLQPRSRRLRRSHHQVIQTLMIAPSKLLPRRHQPRKKSQRRRPPRRTPPQIATLAQIAHQSHQPRRPQQRSQPKRNLQVEVEATVIAAMPSQLQRKRPRRPQPRRTQTQTVAQAPDLMMDLAIAEMPRRKRPSSQPLPILQLLLLTQPTRESSSFSPKVSLSRPLSIHLELCSRHMVS